MFEIRKKKFSFSFTRLGDYAHSWSSVDDSFVGVAIGVRSESQLPRLALELVRERNSQSALVEKLQFFN